jgi:ketosteroid isomerase-like protein
MEFLSEDPTYVVGALGLVAAALLIALKVTQQGKYLIWASASVGLALVVMLVEWLWVTDNERIEQTVYDLGRAVAASDSTKMLGFLTDDVIYVSRQQGSMPTADTRLLAAAKVKDAKFDFLRITHLRANAGGQSRRGTAEFQVVCGGSIQQGGTTYNFGTTNSSWSLGLRETSPGVWKVNRITPVVLPGNQSVLP